MPRTIVHLDADAFYASVEQASDSRLRGKPVAVGGQKRGIIASASYEARKFGVYTPMPTVRARKLCPKLIVVPGDYEQYERFSRCMFSFAYDFTPDVEQTSIDEGYFDLTGCRKSPLEIALTVRKAIGQKLKISVSEGIGVNKLVSQIASKLTKPAAFAQVLPGQEIPFLHPLLNKWLPGIGPKAAGRLNAAGLACIGQIAGTPLDLLHVLMGNMAQTLRDQANGIDDRPLMPEREPQKSYSQQETFAGDLTDEEYIEAVLRRMADNLFAKVREEGRSIRTLTVKVRYNDMGEDQVSESLAEPTDLETDVYGRLHNMLRAAWKRRVSLRLVSLKLSNVYDGRFRSELALDVPAQRQYARERLAVAVDALRKTGGHYVIMRGHDFRLRDAPCEVVAPVPVAAKPPTLQKPVARRDATGDYVPLRVHSHYSFLDSTLSPLAIVELAKRHEMSAVAMTDTGNLHGAVEFVLAAKQAGIKPILGTELNFGGKPLLLYVESAKGYHNLCRLLSHHAEREATNGDEASVVSQQRRPFQREELEGFTEGLIAVSEDARLAEKFPGRFYGMAMGKELPSPAAACPAIRYATPGDRQRYDIVQSIRTLTLLREEHPDKRRGGRFHFRTPTEMAAACKEHPEWLRYAREIAERCNFDLPFGKPQFPAYKPADGSPPSEFLRRLVMEGLRKRYGARASQFQPQVMEELGIINEVGYEEYFLITWDFLQDCKKRGIEWITRGSAADSLVCYCLGISGVCPIRFDLYFRRFLNKDRMALNKLPDIDIDFAHDLKDEVVKLIFEKYGREHCAVVGGFSTFQARSAFAEVAKVLGVSEREARKFTDHFPWSFGGGWVPAEHTPSGGARIVEMLRASPENRDLPLDEEPFKTALQMAEGLDGVPRNPKMHPCGLVLSRQPMHELTPTFISNKGYATTHFDMDAVETIGLVKMDILAQGGLAAMRDVKQSLSAKRTKIDLEELEPWQDKQVWEMIASGGARAVHHIESTAYGVEAYQSAWLKKYFPVEFMAAVLSNEKGFYDPIVYVLECHRLGINLLPPSINLPGPLFRPEGQFIRVPVRYVKGLTERTNERILAEHKREPFSSLADFFRRVTASPEEMESLLRVGAFDEFGRTRTAQFWECQFLHRTFGSKDGSRQGLLLPPPGLDRLPEVPLAEPTRRERLESENELLGYPASGHPLELNDHVAWDTYCPVSRLGEHVGEEVVTCGLVVEQRIHHQITGEPMKFLTLADWTGMVETELFAQTYRSYGLATVRYPVLEITAKVEPFENGRGFSLRVLRAGKPRIHPEIMTVEFEGVDRSTMESVSIGLRNVLYLSRVQ